MKSLAYSGFLEGKMILQNYKIQALLNNMVHYFLGTRPHDTNRPLFEPILLLKEEGQIWKDIKWYVKSSYLNSISGWILVMPRFEVLNMAALTAISEEKIIVFPDDTEQVINKVKILLSSTDALILVTVNLSALPCRVELEGAGIKADAERHHFRALGSMYKEIRDIVVEKGCFWIATENPDGLSKRKSAQLERFFLRNTKN